MFDLLLFCVSVCGIVYYMNFGFKSGWVTFSLLCTVVLLSCILWLPSSGEVYFTKDTLTEISTKTNGNIVTVVSREDCIVYEEVQVKYLQWFVVTQVIRNGTLIPPELLTVEGRTCKYVEDNLL